MILVLEFFKFCFFFQLSPKNRKRVKNYLLWTFPVRSMTFSCRKRAPILTLNTAKSCIRFKLYFIPNKFFSEKHIFTPRAEKKDATNTKNRVFFSGHFTFSILFVLFFYWKERINMIVVRSAGCTGHTTNWKTFLSLANPHETFVPYFIFYL